MRAPYIGVIGAGTCNQAVNELAAEVGRGIARGGAVLICGGLAGVMTAAARGARDAGGHTVGILPGTDIDSANPFIEFPVATNMGQARNAIIVQTAQVLIAVAGGHGTLSEIAMALKLGKPVLALSPRFDIPGVRVCASAEDAVAKALAHLNR